MSHPQCPHGAQPSGTGMKGSSVGTLWMELMAPGAAVPPRPSVWDQNTSHSEGCCELRWGGGVTGHGMAMLSGSSIVPMAAVNRAAQSCGDNAANCRRVCTRGRFGRDVEIFLEYKISLFQRG